MRIEYLLLENFAIVKSGMGLDKLELDFRKFHKNIITLIVGNNGTGKTGGVLANLHPFAGLGHLEARDDSDMIIPEKDGHKVIIFSTKKHLYYIEHFYKYNGKKRSRKISSYCKKDNKELNPSGSVTNFNLIIENEFQIDLNFLKLMRLGPNVKNFISLGATERKSFIAKLLQSVERYLKDQKYANEKSTLLSNALKIALSKKKKLGIDDITTLHDQIRKSTETLTIHKNQREELLKSLYMYKGSIDASKFDSYNKEMSECNNELLLIKKEYNQLVKPKYKHIELDEDMFGYYNERISNYNNDKLEVVAKIASINTKISSLKEEMEELDNEISSIKDDIESEDLADYIKKLEDKISYYKKNFNSSEVPKISKEALSSDVDKMNMILFHIDQILQLPYYTLKYFRDNYDKYEEDLDKLNLFIKKRMNKVNEKLSCFNTKSDKQKSLYVFFLPEKCKSWKECPYYMSETERQNNTKNKERKDDLFLEQECLDGLTQILNHLYFITKILNMRKNIKEYTLNMDIVMEVILNENKKYLPQPKMINDLLEKIEFHDEYLQNKEDLKNAKLRMDLLKNGKYRSKKDIIAEQSKLIVKIHDLEKQRKQYDDKLEKLNQKLNATEEMVQDYSIYTNYRLKSSEYNNKLQVIKNKTASLAKIKRDMESYKYKVNIYEHKLSLYNEMIKNDENALVSLRSKETIFNQLTTEIQTTKKYFEYTELIKDAVSNKTGIPKIHILFYCRALKSIANKIISDIYDGELILREFEITDTKFNIPYYTKGVNVSDIRYGSQAETSVATIAISFAILMQFMPKYNIMLLDEIDGPLYETNKEKFFASIEGELKDIGCEQVFMITQSKMYNDYPVNLIITDPEYKNYVSNKQSVIFQR